MSISNNELTITRTVKAPQELVWRAWTEADRLARWWGPKNFKMLVVSLNLHPGGAFHYSMQNPQGQEMWGKFIFKEIVRPEKMVFSDGFADAEGNLVKNPYISDWPLEIMNTLTLSEQEGKTLISLSATPVNATEKEIKIFNDNRDSMNKGFDGTWEQLDDYLAEIQK